MAKRPAMRRTTVEPIPVIRELPPPFERRNLWDLLMRILSRSGYALPIPRLRTCPDNAEPPGISREASSEHQSQPAP
jgi:hypothetical protein